MAVQFKRSSALGVINLTPMIDVVFLLLVFIMVTARFEQEDRELKVVLPAASEAKPLIAEPTELFINVDADGSYFVDGRTMRAEEVEQLLNQAATNNPGNQSVVIRADKRVPVDFVVTVMNLCNRTGIFDYTLTTRGE